MIEIWHPTKETFHRELQKPTTMWDIRHTDIINGNVIATPRAPQVGDLVYWNGSGQIHIYAGDSDPGWVVVGSVTGSNDGSVTIHSTTI